MRPRFNQSRSSKPAPLPSCTPTGTSVRASGAPHTLHRTNAACTLHEALTTPHGRKASPVGRQGSIGVHQEEAAALPVNRTARCDHAAVSAAAATAAAPSGGDGASAVADAATQDLQGSALVRQICWCLAQDSQLARGTVTCTWSMLWRNTPQPAGHTQCVCVCVCAHLANAADAAAGMARRGCGDVEEGPCRTYSCWTATSGKASAAAARRDASSFSIACTLPLVSCTRGRSNTRRTAGRRRKRKLRERGSCASAAAGEHRTQMVQAQHGSLE
jgi:hypothetical protein